MRSAVVLIWLSLGWTLLCFLFYRDRELIIQASLPVWVVSVFAWVALRTIAASFQGRWRRVGAKTRTRKTVLSESVSPSTSKRGALRGSATKLRKR